MQIVQMPYFLLYSLPISTRNCCRKRDVTRSSGTDFFLPSLLSVDRQVAAAVREVAPSLAKDEFTDVAVSYVASICCTLMDLKQTSDEEWAGVGEMLGLLVKDLPADASATLKGKCADMMVAEPEDDDDEDAEELCNCQFTLAYGKDKTLEEYRVGSPSCAAETPGFFGSP